MTPALRIATATGAVMPFWIIVGIAFAVSQVKRIVSRIVPANGVEEPLLIIVINAWAV